MCELWIILTIYDTPSIYDVLPTAYTIWKSNVFYNKYIKRKLFISKWLQRFYITCDFRIYQISVLKYHYMVYRTPYTIHVPKRFYQALKSASQFVALLKITSQAGSFLNVYISLIPLTMNRQHDLSSLESGHLDNIAYLVFKFIVLVIWKCCNQS